MMEGAVIESTSLWFYIFLAAGATALWRVLGVVLAGRVQPDSAAFDAVNAVAYAMVAGLMTRVIVFPVGLVAETPMLDRVLALFAAVLIWKLRGGAVLEGLGAGIAVFAFFVAAREGGVF